MKIDLIGVSGKATSGKDYFARNVCVPFDYMPWAFAWPLKVQVLSQYGFSYEETFVTKPAAVRTALQHEGTDVGRAKNENVLVDQTRAWIQTLHDNCGINKFVITDVRFPNECRLIRELGGKLVRMTHGFGLAYGLAGTPQALHRSETALDEWRDWDLEIINGTGSISAAWLEGNQSFQVGEGQTLTAARAMTIVSQQSGVLV